MGFICNGSLSMLLRETVHGSTYTGTSYAFGGALYSHAFDVLNWQSKLRCLFVGEAGILPSAAYPVGYSKAAYGMALKDGGIATRLSGVEGTGLVVGSLTLGYAIASALSGAGLVVGDIIGVAWVQVAASGVGSILANMVGGTFIAADLSGGGSAAAFVDALLHMGALLEGDGAISADVTGAMLLAAVLTGDGSLAPLFVSLGMGILTVLAGDGVLAAGTEGLAHLAAEIAIGAKPSADEIAAAVWSTIATSFVSPGTMGRKLNDAGGGSSPLDIADAVWDEASSEHVALGSFGKMVATISASMEIVRQIEAGRWKIARSGGNYQMTFYDDDDQPLFTFNLKDDAGAPSADRVFERTPVT
jgi:hypothetical protein